MLTCLKTHEKKSPKALKAVRKRIRNDYNLEGGKSEIRLPSRLIKWIYADLFPARKRMKKNQDRLLRPLEKEPEMIIIKGRGEVLKLEFPNNDKMKICWLVSSPKTHKKKSAETLKAVWKRIRDDYNLRGEGVKFESRKSEKMKICWLVSITKMHRKKSANTSKTVRKELETFVI